MQSDPTPRLAVQATGPNGATLMDVPAEVLPQILSRVFDGDENSFSTWLRLSNVCRCSTGLAIDPRSQMLDDTISSVLGPCSAEQAANARLSLD